MQEQELKTEIVRADEQVRAIVVKTKDDFEIASAYILSLKDLRKKVIVYWKDMKGKTHQAWKAVCDSEKNMLDPVDRNIKILDQKNRAFLTEQENIRKEEQRKLDEDRRKKEEAERRRLEERAARAEEKGKLEKAEQLREKKEDVYIPPATVEPEIEKTTRTDAGTISQKKDIEIRITDPMAILRAVVAGQLPIGIVEIKESKLKQAIKLQAITNLEGCIIREVVNTQYRGKTA